MTPVDADASDRSLSLLPVPRHVHQALQQGHCVGSSPELFTSADPLAQCVALADCDGCPVQRECLLVVQPTRSYFDGVAGGQAYIDGLPVNTSPAAAAVPVQRVTEDHIGRRLDALRLTRQRRPELSR